MGRHQTAECPAKAQAMGRAKTLVSSLSTDTPPHRFTPVIVTHLNYAIPSETLIDSGADINLLSWELTRELGIAVHELPVHLEAKGVNGQKLFRVSHAIDHVKLNVQTHKESIFFPPLWL